MNDYDEAVKALRSPQTWREGAFRLAALGDGRAIRPLVAAYESRPEASKVCLLDAMDTLGAGEHAAVLMAADSAEDRRMGAHLAELFASDDQLAPLIKAVRDVDGNVRKQALRSIGLQRQTAAWEQAMITLLESDDVQARSTAIDKLATRHTALARLALQDRLERETDATLCTRLAAALEAQGRRPK